MTCYKSPENVESPIEIYQHDDNFLLEYPQFFYDCTSRPTSGKIIGTVNEFFPEMSSETFEDLCSKNDIFPVDILSSSAMTTTNCDLIAEPDGINKFDPVAPTVSDGKKTTLWSFLKRKR